MGIQESVWKASRECEGQFVKVLHSPQDTPTLNLLVMGESIPFLVDSGASWSIIMKKALSSVPLW